MMCFCLSGFRVLFLFITYILDLIDFLGLGFLDKSLVVGKSCLSMVSIIDGLRVGRRVVSSLGEEVGKSEMPCSMSRSR